MNQTNGQSGKHVLIRVPTHSVRCHSRIPAGYSYRINFMVSVGDVQYFEARESDLHKNILFKEGVTN